LLGGARVTVNDHDATGSIRFSLVMPTIGRFQDAECFLESLRAQTFEDFELIVVDQGPADRLAPLLSRYKDEFSILHLRSRSKGASRARNEGLRSSSGDIVTFPDDDCWYPPDLLARVARRLVANHELDGVTGRSLDEHGADSNGKYGLERGPVEKANVWTRGVEYAIFLRREAISGLWFDEEVGPGAGTVWGCGEGTDYLLRMLDRGMRLYYDPDFVVHHTSPVPPYNAKIISRAYNYGCGIGEVIRRHRYPAWFKAKWLIRPLGGALLALIGLKLPLARYRWSTFRGRLRGILP
jgi:glycosyltransferase involved in cell wall biosynthesis